MRTTLQAVLFDLDDTLLIDDPATWAVFDAVADLAAAKAGVNEEKFSEAAKDLGESLFAESTVGLYCERIGISPFECLWGEFDDPIPNLAEVREWSRPFRRQVWHGALERCGIRDPALGDELDSAFFRLRRERIVLMPGAVEVLEELRPDYRLGMLTNGAPSLQQEKIDALKLEPHFDAVLISGRLGIGKPSPEIFHEMARRLNVDPEGCVMLGNSLERDIAGARAAGMHTIWIHVAGCGDTGDAVPDARIESLGELKRALETLPAALA